MSLLYLVLCGSRARIAGLTATLNLFAQLVPLLADLSLHQLLGPLERAKLVVRSRGRLLVGAPTDAASASWTSLSMEDYKPILKNVSSLVVHLESAKFDHTHKTRAAGAYYRWHHLRATAGLFAASNNAFAFARLNLRATRRQAHLRSKTWPWSWPLPACLPPPIHTLPARSLHPHSLPSSLSNLQKKHTFAAPTCALHVSHLPRPPCPPCVLALDRQDVAALDLQKPKQTNRIRDQPHLNDSLWSGSAHSSHTQLHDVNSC